MPLDFEPGARWQYSVGLDLLGLVIQRASGMAFEDFLAARIFQPLSMNDTGFHVPAEKMARFTTNYSVEDGVLSVIDDRVSSPFAQPSLPSGGAGLVSSAADYARFCAMMLGGGEANGVRIAQHATIATATSNLLPPQVDTSAPELRGTHFGAGLMIKTPASAVPGEEPAGSYEWAGAAGTHMWIDPSNDAFAVLMTQHMPSFAYPLGGEFRRAFYADLAAAPE